MNIQVRQCGAVRIIKPSGELKSLNTEALKCTIEDALKECLGRIVIDLSGISFINSQALGVLVDISREIRLRGQTLRLSHLNHTLKQVLELTGTLSLFDIYEDSQTAVRSFL